jgi:L-lactate dehydrogenase
MAQESTTERDHQQPVRVAIVGVGQVGSTFAYTLLMSGIASEIVLVDVDHERAVGEAMDLNHAAPFAHPTDVTVGDYADCAEATLTVIAAGAAQKSGETRLELVDRNTEVFEQIVPAIDRHDPRGIILVTTNPVDPMTYVTKSLSSLPPSRIIGSGTVLDTARFRHLLGERFDVDPQNVHAYIIGEHGDSEVPLWSLANIAGMRLADFCETHDLAYDQETMDELFDRTRNAAYEIIDRKGATHFAIAAGLLSIVRAIVRNQRTVLTVSTLLDGDYGIDDVCLSLPCVVGRHGLERRLNIELADEELEALRQSARIVEDSMRELDLPK